MSTLPRKLIGCLVKREGSQYTFSVPLEKERTETRKVVVEVSLNSSLQPVIDMWIGHKQGAPFMHNIHLTDDAKETLLRAEEELAEREHRGMQLAMKLKMKEAVAIFGANDA